MMYSPGAKETWQTPRPTIKERCMFMFNNELLSDVKFVVGSLNGESGRREVIPAHKFVLSISSPVFLAMFHGNMAETSNLIELPDCDYESLLEFFRYLYSDDVKLSGTNVLQVLYLANKYMVPSLANRCTEYLQNSLDAGNVFSILPLAQTFEEEELVEHCWDLIDKNTEDIVRSDEFVDLDKCLVESIVQRESLNIREFDLFKAVVRWATRETERRGLNVNDDVKRSVLGEGIVKAIRFPVMTQNEFMSVVPDSNILTTKEIVDLMKHFSGVPTTPLPFIQTPRKGTIRKDSESGRRRFGTYIPPTIWFCHTRRHLQSSRCSLTS